MLQQTLNYFGCVGGGGGEGRGSGSGGGTYRDRSELHHHC